MVCPNPTRRWLTSFHSSKGSQVSKAFLVSSGVLVGFLTHPILLLILWTWVSTPVKIRQFVIHLYYDQNISEKGILQAHLKACLPMPVTLSQATNMQIWAIFGPTPRNLQSFSTVSGMSPLYWSLRVCDVFLIYCTFVWNWMNKINLQTNTNNELVLNKVCLKFIIHVVARC